MASMARNNVLENKYLVTIRKRSDLYFIKNDELWKIFIGT